MVIETFSPEETEELGIHFGKEAKPGTCFTRHSSFLYSDISVFLSSSLKNGAAETAPPYFTYAFFLENFFFIVYQSGPVIHTDE